MRKYNSPIMTLIRFSAEDVIASSGEMDYISLGDAKVAGTPTANSWGDLGDGAGF